ncbi:MAG: hypothetical protein WBY93_23535 [Candidatus Binatus sp.]
MSKTVFVVLVFALALFLPARIGLLLAKGQAQGSVAWAQDASDADDSADVSTEPATAPPDIAGDWSGDVDDNNPDIGERDFSIEIFQKKSKFNGNWEIGSGLTGSFKGKIKADGESLTLKLKRKHSKCRITAEGTLGTTTPDVAGLLEEVPEISGTYKASAKKCDGAEGGTFQLIENVD